VVILMAHLINDSDTFNNSKLKFREDSIEQNNLMLEEENFTPFENSSNDSSQNISSNYILKQPKVEQNPTNVHKDHLIQTLQGIQYVQSLTMDHNLEGKYVDLPY
jgi:hypothetical protein